MAVHRAVNLATASRRAVTCGDSVVVMAEGCEAVPDHGRGGGGGALREG